MLESPPPQMRMKPVEKEPDYPMCMTFFRPLNLCVFALSGDLVIYKLKWSCSRKVFTQVATHKFSQPPENKYNELLPTSLVCALHKVTGKLLVCVALQTSRQAKAEHFNHYLVVYELDQHTNYQLTELKRIRAKQPNITKVIYHEDCGLLMGCFRGYIELFDPTTFESTGRWTGSTLPPRPNELDPKTPKQKDKKYETTVDCLDYSSVLDLVAFGGLHGVGFLDSRTMRFKCLHQPHLNEVHGVHFYDQQMQLCSMSVDGELALWDAQKLTVLQTVRNRSNMIAREINTHCFNKEQGTFIMATTKLFTWQLSEDAAMRVESEQQHTVARDFLR